MIAIAKASDTEREVLFGNPERERHSSDDPSESTGTL